MTTRLSRRQILLTSGAVLLLAACSGASAPGAAAPGATAAPAAATAPSQPGSTTSQPASTPAAAAATSQAAAGSDACRLVTQAEVAAAFGESMLKPVATTSHGEASCTYTHEAGGLDLNVTISARPSSAAAIKQAETLYGGGAADVPGVGDAAFSVAGILEFVKGTTLVTMGTGDGPAIISTDRFNALAALAAGRV